MRIVENFNGKKNSSLQEYFVSTAALIAGIHSRHIAEGGVILSKRFCNPIEVALELIKISQSITSESYTFNPDEVPQLLSEEERLIKACDVKRAEYGLEIARSVFYSEGEEKFLIRHRQPTP